MTIPFSFASIARNNSVTVANQLAGGVELQYATSVNCMPRVILRIQLMEMSRRAIQISHAVPSVSCIVSHAEKHTQKHMYFINARSASRLSVQTVSHPVENANEENIAIIA